MKLVTLILVLSLAVAASAEDLKTYYEKTLKAIDQLDPTCPDRAAYLASVACCTSRLNVLTKVTFEHPSWPQRYGESARWLLAELHEAAPLPRLSHEMDAIQRKLEVAGTGPETQRAQERVIAELDALIKKMREREGRGDEDSNASRDGDINIRKKQDLAYQREWAKDALRHPDALQALDRLKVPRLLPRPRPAVLEVARRDEAVRPVEASVINQWFYAVGDGIVCVAFMLIAYVIALVLRAGD